MNASANTAAKEKILAELCLRGDAFPLAALDWEPEKTQVGRDAAFEELAWGAGLGQPQTTQEVAAWGYDGTQRLEQFPQSLNLYAYVNNNPVTNTDRDGHWCIFGIGTTCSSSTSPPAPSTPAVPPGAPGTSTFPLIAAQDKERQDPTVQPDPPGPGRQTYCNIASCKIGTDTNAPMSPLVDSNGQPNLANTDASTLANSSQYHEVTRDQAQQLANQGVPVFAVQGNPSGHGHIATVRPDNAWFSSAENAAPGIGPLINNIGASVGITHASAAFPSNQPVHYYAPNPGGGQ